MTIVDLTLILRMLIVRMAASDVPVIWPGEAEPAAGTWAALVGLTSTRGARAARDGESDSVDLSITIGVFTASAEQDPRAGGTIHAGSSAAMRIARDLDQWGASDAPTTHHLTLRRVQMELAPAIDAERSLVAWIIRVDGRAQRDSGDTLM